MKALDELEQLVVMQLFELAKMSMSGTGMLKLDTSDPKTNYYRIQTLLPNQQSPAAAIRGNKKCP